MIICDEKQFAFIHIPKCAGTSMRRALRAIDTTGEAFFRIADHPLLGRVHLAHLTLTDLAGHYPDSLGKLVRYRSVALVRDPLERFTSAIFQRLREFRNIAQSAMTAELIESEAEAVIAYLESAPGRLNLEHVHFNRQCDFIELNGERIVERLYPVMRLADAAEHVRRITGIEVGEERRNPTTELSIAPLRPLQRLLRDHYARRVPAVRRTQIREAMTRAGFYREVTKAKFIAEGSAIDRFVRQHYARDFEILEECERQLERRVA